MSKQTGTYIRNEYVSLQTKTEKKFKMGETCKLELIGKLESRIDRR